MKRPVKKAIAFILFLSLMLQTAFVCRPVPVEAKASAAADFDISEYGWLYGYHGNETNLVIPGNLGVDDVQLSYPEVPIKSVTIPGGIYSVSLLGIPELTTVKLSEGVSTIYIDNCPSIQSIEIPSSASSVCLYDCSALKTIKLSKGLESLNICGCPSLQNYTVPSTVWDFSTDCFTNFTIDKNNPYFELFDGCLYKEKFLYSVDPSKTTIDVKDGTLGVCSWALCRNYVVTTINFPDSVKYFDFSALAGASSIKKLTLPKNLISIYGYAFDGLGAESIKIPASVTFVSDYAFNGYRGSVVVDPLNAVLASYQGGIYNSSYDQLYYYRKNETNLTLHSNCTSFYGEALNGCNFETLDIPEGVLYFSPSLGDCKRLKTISIPASLTYFDEWELNWNPPANLEKILVDSDNQFYCSYQGCLYSKDKHDLLYVPFKTSKLEVCNGCVSVGYYSLGLMGHYDEANDEWIERRLTATIPGTVTEIDSLDGCDMCYVQSNSAAAQWICQHNNEEWCWNPIKYEFTDSSENVLSKISVPDALSVKNGKKTQLVFTYPWGLNLVKAKELKKTMNNTFASVKITSSDPKVAKVNAFNGKLKAKSVGTATLTTTIKMSDGTSKVFTTDVTVKAR